MDREDWIIRYAVDSVANERPRSTVEHAEFRRYEAPCVECPYRQRCKDELLACAPFRTFVGSPVRVDYNAVRVPSREIYDAVFRADDEEDADG